MIAHPDRVQADRLGVLAESAYLRPGGHLAGPVGHGHGHDDTDPHTTKSRLLMCPPNLARFLAWLSTTAIRPT